MRVVNAPDPQAAAAMVSAREAAALLGVNERTIRRAIARGELTAVKRGRAFAIPVAEVTRFGAWRNGRTGRNASDPEPARPNNVTPLVLLRSPELAREERRPRPTLPVPLTRLIGREREVAMLEDLLWRDHARLVTLTGPGGVGKTRLALHLAASRPAVAGEVAFVSLAEVPDSALVLPAIARAVGARESPGQSAAHALRATLNDRPLFLVLDNFEHLTDGAEHELVDLLQHCPGLVVLVTSRTPLRVRGEQRVRLAPLSLPEAGTIPDAGQLETYGAIALFVARAHEADHRFALDNENAAAVIDVCRRLDGLPLAIELAAAWVRLLPPPALLQQLDRRLPLLTGGAHDQPPRLQTMHNAIDWSYGLLTSDEQRFFRRLAVFAGGFTLDAAESASRQVGEPARLHREGDGDDPAPALERPLPCLPTTPSPSILDFLAALCDKSLLQPIPDGGEPRFAMLETVREFALARLAASGEEAAMREAHAAYFLALAETAANAAERVGSHPWMRRLTAERPNLRAALDWLDATGNAAATLQMTGALWHYWYRFGEMAEGRARLERALAAAPPEADPAHQARALRGAGVLAWQSADYDVSRDRLEAALLLYRAVGDQIGVAWVHNSRGCLAATLSDSARAEACFNQALAIFRARDDAVGIAQLTANLGELAANSGDHKRAVVYLETAIARWRALADRVGAARAQVVLTHALLARNAPAQADAVLREALVTIRDNDYGQILPAALRAAAQLAMWRSDPLAATRWYGAEERLRLTLGASLTAARRASFDRSVAAVRDTLGETAFAAAWADGRGLSATQAIAEVLNAGKPNHDHGASPAGHGLSPRQREVLRLLAAGRTDREIAESLFIARRTASKHVSAILTKLGVPTRAAAVAVAARQGLD